MSDPSTNQVKPAATSLNIQSPDDSTIISYVVLNLHNSFFKKKAQNEPVPESVLLAPYGTVVEGMGFVP